MQRAYDPIAALFAGAAAFALAPAGLRLEGGVLGVLLAWAAVVDARSHRLPDIFTALIVASGLAFAVLAGPDAIRDRLIGALAGFAAFAAIGLAYRRMRGREGLGLGDAKLFAGAGAWLGWAGLPLVSLVAALTGMAHFAILATRGRPVDAATPIPFGPHLCVAIWAVWRAAPILSPILGW